MLRIFPICCAILLNWTSVCLSQNLKTEPNNDLSSATMILSGSQVEGSLFDRNDQDYYRLNLSDRQEVTVAFSTTPRERFNETNIEVSIFDASQTKNLFESHFIRFSINRIIAI